MKVKNILKYIYIPVVLFFVVACSVKKDKMLNRGYHALTTKYNILFHGNLAYEEALEALKQGYFDDYWDILPIERIDIKVNPEKEFRKGQSLESKEGSIFDNFSFEGETPGMTEEEMTSGFERAEDKAVKAIQKHSMDIRGREKNFQMDEAYLLLGKSRYYDGRFIPALEAFNYILFKYQESDKINAAKVWREKTNLRLKYDDLAIKNLNELIKERKGRMDKQVEADAYATLAQGYINISEIDNAATALKSAVEITPNKEEQARYMFILGQLYGKLNKKEEAYQEFQKVIELNRKSPRLYVMQAHASQFQLKRGQQIDSVDFLNQYKKLLNDRENRPYLDILNRQVGLFYEDSENTNQALKYLKEAVKQGREDQQLKARNYIDIAQIYFNTAGYALSGQYYDSALAVLPPKAKETFDIAKRRESLREVVELEQTAHNNDSILNLVAMNQEQRTAYFQNYVDELRKEDFRKLQANLKGKAGNQDYFNMPSFGDAIDFATGGSGVASGGKTSFYFYSTQATSYGKIEFKKRWGNRGLADNWRWSSSSSLATADTEGEQEQVAEQVKEKPAVGEPEDARYDIEGYINQIPVDSTMIAQLKKDRDQAYFELGSIYSERFKKYEMGAEKFESLLIFDPEEKLVLPTLYKLYKIYEEIDPAKAMAVKNTITTQHPDSRYAKLLQNMAIESASDLAPEQVYANVFKVYQTGDYLQAFREVENALDNLDNEDFVSKFELLKANITARIDGLEKYKEALNFVALNYSSTPEGKEAANILAVNIPALEAKNFSEEASNRWKIVFERPVEDSAGREMKRKMIDYANSNAYIGIKFSEDFYTRDSVFFVLHGFMSKENAEDAIQKLTGNSEGILYAITAEDYSVVQIKKNWDNYKLVQEISETPIP